MNKLLALIVLNIFLCLADGFLTYIIQSPINYKMEANPFIRSDRDLLLSRIVYFTVAIPILFYTYRWNKTVSYICVILANILLLYAVITNLIGLWWLYGKAY